MRGGSLRRYMAPGAGGSQDGGGGIDGILVPEAKEVVKDAWRASVEAVGGPEVMKRAATAFKRKASASAETRARKRLKQEAKRRVAQATINKVKRFTDIFG